jgi:hypothetical protein
MLEGRVLMDDLLREFLTETSESLDTVDNQLVRFEQDPSSLVVLDVDRVLEILPKTALAA